MSAAAIEWDDKYSVGIQLIDEQHKEMIRMANSLYIGCLKGPEGSGDACVQAIHHTMDYVRYHFASEEQLLEKMQYPDRLAHKQQHEEFILWIFSRVRNFENGSPLIPNVFIRYLRDWVLTHIAVTDKKYAAYLQVFKSQNPLDTLTVNFSAGFQLFEKYFKPELLPPPEMFWG